VVGVALVVSVVVAAALVHPIGCGARGWHRSALAVHTALVVDAALVVGAGGQRWESVMLVGVAASAALVADTAVEDGTVVEDGAVVRVAPAVGAHGGCSLSALEVGAALAVGARGRRYCQRLWSAPLSVAAVGVRL
jgi:hypothetical protein